MTPTCAADQRYRHSLFGLHATVFTVLVLCRALMAVLMRYPTVVYDELVYAGFGRFFSGTALGLLRRLLPVPRQVLLWAAAITTLLYPPYLL